MTEIVKYFAPFHIDPTTRTLWRDDVRVPLTHKAFDILRVLVERAGHVVPKDAILGAVWPDTYVHPDNVKVLIGEIRRALGDDPARPQFIRAIVKRGYIFIAPVVDEPSDLTAPAESPIFVGRHSEMDLMLRASDEASAANRRLLFVNGDAGVGKTALCEAFLRVASTRHTVRAAWAQCMKSSGPAEPYAALVDVLNRLARTTEDELVRTTLARHAPSWLPMLTAFGDDRHRANAAHVGGAPRMLREIVSAIEAIAEKAFLLIWIEDLHWADSATVDFVSSLGLRTDPARLLVIATARPADTTAAGSPVRRMHADLVSRGRAIEIRLDAFSVEDVTQFLEERFDATLAARLSPILHRATAGNPLFLTTAVDYLVRKNYIATERGAWALTISPAALEDAIPVSFATAVSRELDELTDDERVAVRAASVIGVKFSLWQAAQAAGVDEVPLEAVLEMLARRRRFIVREGVAELANGVFTPSYRFRHGLSQEIVLDSMDGRTRAEAHERAGLATERIYAGREHEAACELAGHFHASGDHARAVRYFRLAAANATRRFAPREAVALLHGALAHAARLFSDERYEAEVGAMLELGQAQFAAGDATLASETLLKVERRAEDADRPNDRLRALLAVAEAQAGVSHTVSMGLARRITEAAPSATEEMLTTSAALRAAITELAFDGWSDDVADRCFDMWRSLPRTATDEHRSLAIRLLFLQISRSAYATAWTAGRKLLPSTLRSGNLSDSILCCYLLGVAALHLGRWGDASDVAAEGAAIGDKTGSVNYAVSMRLVQAWIALEGQRWEEARRLSLADRALVEGVGCTNAMQMSLLFGGAAAVGLGQFDEAADDLNRLREWYRSERLVLDWFWKPQLQSYLAELAMRRGDLDRALLEAEAAQDAAGRSPERTWRGRAHVMAAQVALERRAFADAERHLRQARRETRGIDAPLASWRIEAVTATLLERTAQPDSARRARIRYEKTFNRLERSIADHPAIQPQVRPPGDNRMVH